MRRRIRFRTTAEPTLRGTTNDRRTWSGGAAAEPSAATNEIRNDPDRAEGAFWSAANARRPRTGTSRRPTRSCRGTRSDSSGACTTDRYQAESRARPLSRRARITARPPFVDMRSRKPCFLARRRWFGWNVRFIEASWNNAMSRQLKRRRCAFECRRNRARLRGTRPNCKWWRNVMIFPVLLYR